MPPSSSPPAQPACRTVEGSLIRLWPQHLLPPFSQPMCCGLCRASADPWALGWKLTGVCVQTCSRHYSAPLPQLGSSRTPVQLVTSQSQLRTLLSLLPGLCNPGTPHCSSASQRWHPSHCRAWGSLSCNVTSLAEPRGAAVLGKSGVWGFRSPQNHNSPALAASPFPAKQLFLQMPAGVFLLAGDVFRYPRLHSFKLTAKAQLGCFVFIFP